MTGMARSGGRDAECARTLGRELGRRGWDARGRPGVRLGGNRRLATRPTGTGTSTRPSTNPPNELTLVGGTPQTAQLQSAFATPLQVALGNSNGCPVTTAVAGTPVTFTAPAGGASGTFAASGSTR